MKKRICLILFILIMISTFLCSNYCFADDVLSKLGGMSAVSEMEEVTTDRYTWSY